MNVTLTSLEMELEASNNALRQILSFKKSRIVMLEERLLNMSFELASSRAREDEQNLLLRRSAQLQGSMMSESELEEENFMIPADVVDDSDDIKSAMTQPSSSGTSSWGSSRMPEDNVSDSGRNLALSSTRGTIGNMTKFDRSENLRVDFPTGGRRRSMTMMDEYSAAAKNSAAPPQRRRRTVVGQLFRSRRSSLTVDKAAEISEQEGEEAPPHRDSNLKQLHDHQGSSRLIGSTVLFPMEDDNYSLGFE